MSQFVENERILKLSISDGVGRVFDSAGGGVVDGADGGGLRVMRRMGNRAWVQHRPWLTQELQKPQSPSLHWLHFQKQSFVDD
jgi:hypothetical protein